MDFELEALAAQLGPEHGSLAGALLPKFNCSSFSSRRQGMTVGTTRPA